MTEFIRDAEDDLLFDHSRRVFLFGALQGDAGALNVLAHLRSSALALDLPSFSQLLVRRATLLREWLMFLETYPVLVIPVSAELPFENDLDMQGDEAFASVWRAQMPQLGLPYLGLPCSPCLPDFSAERPSVCKSCRGAIARISA
jgi:hypothetical protein